MTETNLGGAPTRVLVAIPTIGRPQGCVRAVAGVKSQAMVGPGFPLVLVVDNNSTPDPAIASIDGITSVHEPQAGVVKARNAALAFALEGKFEVLVFLDDDEEPADEQWLSRLIEPLSSSGVWAAAGPVRPKFVEVFPSFVAAHPLFWRQEPTSGADLRQVGAGNLALLLAPITRMGLRFSPAFDQVGGEDTDFSRRLVAAGGRIRWVEDAVVYEHVPESRTTLGWVTRRSFRLGNNRVRRWRQGTPGDPPFALLFIGSIIELSAGSALAVLAWLPSRRIAMRALDRACRGAGFLFGLFGVEYREYAGRPGV